MEMVSDEKSTLGLMVLSDNKPKTTSIGTAIKDVDILVVDLIKAELEKTSSKTLTLSKKSEVKTKKIRKYFSGSGW